MAGPFMLTYVLDGRGGGWTEAFITNAADLPTARSRATTLGDLRAPLLANNITISTCRISDMTVLRDSVFQPINPFSGGLPQQDFVNTINDCPRYELSLTNGGSKRNFHLVAVPDLTIENQAFFPGRVPGFVSNLNNWIAYIKSGPVFLNTLKPIRDRLRGTIVGLSSTDTEVTITTQRPHGLAAGATVKIYVRHPRAMRHLFIVQAPITATTFTVSVPRMQGAFAPPGSWQRENGWTYADVDRDYVLSPIGRCEFDKIGIKKIGRPLYQQRGRAPATRLN